MGRVTTSPSNNELDLVDLFKTSELTWKQHLYHKKTPCAASTAAFSARVVFCKEPNPTTVQ